MENFVHSALRLLLGWVRSAAQWLWKQAETPQSSGVVGWLGQHWLLVTILLCLLGVLVDNAVYFFRWRPDRVWRSFFDSLRNRQPREVQMPVQPAGDTARPEETPVEEPARASQKMEPEGPYLPETMGMPIAELAMEESENQENEEQPNVPEERHRRADRHKNKVSPLKKLFVTPEEEPDYGHYVPARPGGDKRDSFHEPYYPPQWQQPQGQNNDANT